MNESARPLLEITDLTIRFDTFEGSATAVDRVSITVGHGETLGLVGESGCGKSVTAHAVLRLLKTPPAHVTGSILFEDEDLLKVDSDRIRRLRGNRVSMIFQEPMTSLNPVITIGEQIAEAVRLHQQVSQKEAWNRAVEMLTRVRIPDPETRVREYPHQMSGGMRQRAMIAMALSCRPRLLFADEPTTALDVTIQAQIMALMLRLKAEFHTAIVLITHDLGVIAETAGRVAVMYAGWIVEEAPVRALFKDPRHPYTRGLLNSIPVIGRTPGSDLSEIPGRVPSLLEMPAGCRFHPRCVEAMDICRNTPPPMTRPAPDRRVCCWLAAP